MIRRDVTADDGTPAWLLISQLAHARLAAELADAWDDDVRPLVEPRRDFIETVRRHDDGWLVWEQRPEVHGGKPRDFMEMPLDESLAIWRRSIAAAGVTGPAASVIVGGHFRRLLERTLLKHESRHDWPPDFEHLAEEFIVEQDAHRAEYLADCEAGRRASAKADVDRGLHLLQLFDFASLWLCCAARTEPQSMTGPDGEAYVFTPLDVENIVVDPWPFRPAELELSVVGRRIAAIDYPSDAALAEAPSTEIGPRWRLFRR
jgi:hypothetical protein